MTDEIHISSVFGHSSMLREFHMGSTAGCDGAKQETDGGAGLGLEVVTLFQALADHERIRETHDRAHDQFGGFARLDRLEFAGLDTVPQDQLGDVSYGILVRAD